MAAVGVVAVLSRLGIPTSLTLALVGGLTGAGLGFGLPVLWSSVWFVLAMAAIAPWLAHSWATSCCVFSSTCP